MLHKAKSTVALNRKKIQTVTDAKATTGLNSKTCLIKFKYFISEKHSQIPEIYYNSGQDCQPIQKSQSNHTKNRSLIFCLFFVCSFVCLFVCLCVCLFVLCTMYPLGQTNMAIAPLTTLSLNYITLYQQN